jgi:tetraacyldisaccharide 4'-kinase
MRWIERHWQSITPLGILLLPLSLVMFLVVTVRRALYTSGVLARVALPVPVVVVGNITVGGTGKTPLVLWLTAWLRDRGFTPGIVSRGYGGNATGPMAVEAASDPARSGDEPLLLARRSGCPVWIGADRALAAQHLLAHHPECNVVVSDDGLQHYRLARDVEIAVIDGTRGFGNHMLLPAGPLREPVSRLQSVDAIVVNGGAADIGAWSRPAWRMNVAGREFHNVLNPQHRVTPEHFRNQRVHAIAGIGNPERFFRHLQELGVTFTAHAFPDHHVLNAADLVHADADAIVMTEKDAVKCGSFVTENCWALTVDAATDRALGDLVLRKLEAFRP